MTTPSLMNIATMNGPSRIIAIYSVPSRSQIGAPPSTPPFVKNIAGRKMNTRIIERPILAFLMHFFLNAMRT